ncbi:MAG: copper transporter [Actinomycetota bacterium]
MFDFRYHIVSLVAVFLALGIGVVLGSMSAERGVVTEQERALIATMEKDFDNLRAENKQLNTIISADEAFWAGVVPLVVDGKLAGKNVAIVVTGAVDATTLKSLKTVIEQAGGVETSVTTFEGDLGLGDKAVKEKVAGIVGASAGNTATLRSKALDAAAGWIVSGLNAKELNNLAAEGFLKNEGVYDVPVQAVLIIGGKVNGKGLSAENLDAVLIDSLNTQNVVLAGAEISTVKTSYIQTYKNLGLSTVDNLDMPAGQVCAVYLLGGQSGNFGTKATAERLMPEPLKF